jgi:predicted DNA-binding protein YlxM (UPF0122 family)
MATNTDWEAIEREYRANQLSVSEIGRQFSVSHTAINKRAKAHQWARDLQARVQQAARAKLVSDAVSPEVSEANALETVEAAAARVVDVVRSHRKDISTGRRIIGSLFDELIEATEQRQAIDEAIEIETAGDTNGQRKAMMKRAVALPSRAATMQSLAGALKHIVVLERQAFNIDAGDSDEPATQADVSGAVKSAVEKLDKRQRDQLRGIIRTVAGESESDVEGA